MKLTAAIALVLLSCAPAAAQIPRPPTTATPAVEIANVAAILLSSYGNYVHIQGTLYPGDGGGGYYFRNGLVCTVTNYTVLKDKSGNCFYLNTPPGRVLTPAIMGLAANALTVLDGVVTGNQLTSASYCFTALDAGKLAVLYSVNNPAGSDTHKGSFQTTIQSALGCTATLTDNTPNNASGIQVNFGTDDYAAFAVMAAIALPVEFGASRIMLANPCGNTNCGTTRTMTVNNTAWVGGGTVIFAGQTGRFQDDGNLFNFTQNYIRIDGNIVIDGEYQSTGQFQFNVPTLHFLNLIHPYIAPGIVVQNTKGEGYFGDGNTDESIHGLFQNNGDYNALNTNPTDPELGRPFSVVVQNIHGQADLSGMRSKFASQSGLFMLSTDLNATSNLCGIDVENAGYYNFDIESWAGTVALCDAKSIQDPNGVHDYSRIRGGFIFGGQLGVSNVTFTTLSEYGGGGNAVIFVPRTADTYQMKTVIGGIINATTDNNTAHAENVYLGMSGSISSRTAIDTINSDVLTAYPSPFTNGGSNLPDVGIWINKFFSPSKYVASANLLVNNFTGGQSILSIRSGSVASISVGNTNGDVDMDFGSDFEFRNISLSGGTGHSFIGNLRRPFMGEVKPFNITTPKDPYPFDYTNNTVHASWDSTNEGAALNNINTADVPVNTLSLDDGYRYLVMPTAKYVVYNQAHIGKQGVTAENFTYASSAAFTKQFFFCDDWFNFTIPSATARLSFNVHPADYSGPGTVSAIIQRLEVVRFSPLSLLGLDQTGLYADDSAALLGNRLNTIYTGDH